MGGRGAFINTKNGNFSFVTNGQTYYTIGTIDNVKIIIRPGYSVKAPEFSHSENSVYAVVQKGHLKHLSFYDSNHKQIKSIDLLHEHSNMKPHCHINLNHTTAYGVSKEDLELINKIRKEFNLK